MGFLDFFRKKVEEKNTVLEKLAFSDIENWIEIKTRENNLKEYMKSKFEYVLEFSEILKISPLDHVKDLITQWENIQLSSEGEI